MPLSMKQLKNTTLAPLASPALTGTPTAPTAPVGTDSTQLATTEFVANYNGPAGPTKIFNVVDPFFGVQRKHELRGVHTSLINPDTGKFGFGTIKGNGTRFNVSAIDQGGSQYAAGGLETTYASGITGLFERVDDSTWLGGSGELASAAQQMAWKLTCATTHRTIGNGSRTELTGFPLPSAKTYDIDYSYRLDTTWDYGQQAVQPAGLFQVHQETGFGASQAAGSPSIQMVLVGSRLTFIIRSLDSEMGADQGTYTNFGFGDTARIYLATAVPAGVRYVDVRMRFHLDHRSLKDGGQGYFKSWVDGQLVADYVGPTIWPTTQSGIIVNPIPKFGIYMFALNGVATDDVTVNSARGMLSNRILWIRKAAIYSMDGA